MEKNLKALVDKLETRHTLLRDEWISLIRWRTPLLSDYVFQKARAVRQHFYGKDVYIRGLIEFTNYCKMTVITVVSAAVMPKYTATGFPKSRF